MIHKKHQLIFFISLILLCTISLAMSFILNWYSKSGSSDYMDFAHHILLVLTIGFAAKNIDLSKLSGLFSERK